MEKLCWHCIPNLILVVAETGFCVSSDTNEGEFLFDARVQNTPSCHTWKFVKSMTQKWVTRHGNIILGRSDDKTRPIVRISAITGTKDIHTNLMPRSNTISEDLSHMWHSLFCPDTLISVEDSNQSTCRAQESWKRRKPLFVFTTLWLLVKFRLVLHKCQQSCEVFHPWDPRGAVPRILHTWSYRYRIFSQKAGSSPNPAQEHTRQ